MREQPSLTLRLSFFLLMGQLVCFAITLVGLHVVPLFGHDPASVIEWNLLAELRARSAVVNSLVRAENGDVQIIPTIALQTLVKKHPTLQYAVFDPQTGGALKGSSPELAEALRGHSGIITKEMTSFRIRGLLDSELSGSYLAQETPFGRMMIATHGYIFEWRDFFYHIFNDAIDTFKENAFTIGMAIAIGWITLSHGLAPLAVVGQRVRNIDIATLNEKIPLGNTPREVAPLIETINEALAKLESSVGRQQRFLANAAHELRTPLAIMNSRISGPDHPSLRRDLERDIRRLRTIVEQLLVYARFGMHNESLLGKIDLNEMVGSIVDDYALLALKSTKSIEFNAIDSESYIRGDRNALESVIGNLLNNALRAEPTGGAVIVQTSASEVEVVDHGEGISDRDKSSIFEPFWHKSEGGAGLGLAIAKELVEAMGGEIRVEDTLGGGATFKVSFPAA
jgi:signal transduction histidine kinase